MPPVPSEEGDFSTPLRFGRNDGNGGRLFYNLRPLKGKRLTTFCASLALLHPLLSLTHWIFRSLMLPYKSSSHSAKCVRCAPKGATAPSEHFEPYERKSKHVTLTLYSSPKRAIPQPSGPKAPSNLRTLRTFGPEARQPSRRRRVQWRSAPPLMYPVSFLPV